MRLPSMTDCPNHAIYEPGTPWRLSDGTYSKGLLTSSSDLTVDARSRSARAV